LEKSCLDIAQKTEHDGETTGRLWVHHFACLKLACRFDFTQIKRLDRDIQQIGWEKAEFFKLYRSL
jgi:hypothetical protein